MAEKTLQVLLKLKDQLSGELKTAKAGLQNFGDAGKTTGDQVMGMGMAAKVAGGLIGAFLSKKALEGAIDLVQTGAAVMELRDAFNELATGSQQSGNQIISAMRAGTKGLVSDVDLMTTANQALLAQVKISAEEWTRLGALAEQQGDRMGIGTTEALDAITDALMRGRAMRLAGIGVVIDDEQAYAGYAKTLGTTADKLNDAERKQAMLNAIMLQAPTAAEIAEEASRNIGESSERIGVAFENLKNSMAETIAKSQAADVVAQGMDNIANTLTNVNDLHEMNIALLARTGQLQMMMNVHARELAGATHEEAVAAEQLNPELATMSRWLSESGNNAGMSAQQLERMTGTLGKLGAATRRYIYESQALDASVYEAERMADYWAKEEDRAAWTMQTAEGKAKAEEDAAQRTSDAWSSAYSEAQAAADRFQSDVEALFQPSMSVDTTGIMDQLGFHEDTWDEWMRRAADVMNQGTASPWFQQMVSTFPKFQDLLDKFGDPKAAAAAFIEQFQNGFVPEAVNIDAIVAAYQKQMASKEAWQGIYDQAKAAIVAAGGGTVDETILNKVTGADQFGTVTTGFDAVGSSVGGVSSDMSTLRNNATEALSKISTDMVTAKDKTKSWNDELAKVIANFQTIVGLGFTVTITPTGEGAGGATGGSTTGGTGTGTGAGGNGSTGSNSGGGGVNIGNVNVNIDDSYASTLTGQGVHIPT